jgi:hypothetical protein
VSRQSPAESRPAPHGNEEMDPMYVLHIEHPVRDFDAWKKAFDDDPLQRSDAGVHRYQVSRPADDPYYAIVDLEFERREEAQAMLASLKRLWSGAGALFMRDPTTRITLVVESRVLAHPKTRAA